MILSRADQHPRIGKPRNKPNAASDFNHSQSHSTIHSSKFPHPQPPQSSTRNGLSDSREPLISRNPKKTFLLARLRGLGCKATSTRVSAPTVIRSAADWDTQKRGRRKQGSKAHVRARTPDNNVVDVPDICCAPPGINFASDVVQTPSRNPPRTPHIQHSRVARRTRNINHISDTSAQGPSNSMISRAQSSNPRQYRHLHNHFRRGFLEVNTLFERSLDEYMDWRLNVDSMSYEELLELSDKIGYAARGLREEEIVSCLRVLKLSDSESAQSLMTTEKGWRCSICQEEYKADDDVGRLGCGHCHHIDCIKRWLKQKNECPVCKTAPIADK